MMTRQQLSQDIADRYYSMLKDVEPDCLDLVQEHWEEGLALFDTPTPSSLCEALVKGPWRTREMNRFASQLSQYEVLMNEMI